MDTLHEVCCRIQHFEAELSYYVAKFLKNKKYYMKEKFIKLQAEHKVIPGVWN